VCVELTYSKNICDVKKGEAMKVQFTERLKGVRPRRKDIPVRLCRTPAYKASSVSTLFF